MNSRRQQHQSQNSAGKVVSIDEYQLWTAFKGGDIEAYSVIYQQYFFLLYNYGKKISSNHELVKDCIQDLFVKIWNNRENLNQTTSIRYYLLTSLRNKLIDALESPNNRFLTSADMIPLEMEEAAHEDTDFLYQQKHKVFQAMNKLSKHQQRAIHLKFFDDYSNDEIAHELNITTQSVYNLIFKSLRSLRKHMQPLASIFFCFAFFN